MRRTILPGLSLVAGLAVAVVMWPADVSAQRRTSRVRPARPVVVRTAPPVVRHYYRPYYRTYYRSYYRPYYSFYGSFYWQRYPYPYPYPYPYYAYRFDDRAEVRVSVTPREAQVYVDGYFAGLVDDFDGFAQRLRVEPGEHDIEIYLEGFRARRERLLLRPHQSLRMQFALEPLPAGEPQAPRPTPSPSSAPPRGAVVDRYPDRPAAAQPPAREALGTLNLRVQPIDAVVSIDGERWDWPEDVDRLVVDLPEGSHRVEVQREGHRAYSTTVTIRRGETTTLNVSLRRD